MNSGSFPSVYRKFTTQDYKDVVKETTDWIMSNEIVTEHGKMWTQSPGNPADLSDEPLLSPKSLYGGSAGIGIYFLRLYDITGDKKWLGEAESAASHIIATHPGAQFYTDIRAEKGSGVNLVKGRKIGVYNGPVGGGILAGLLYSKTGKELYREYAKQVAQDIIDAALVDASGTYWSESCDFASDGSFVLYLIWLYKSDPEPVYLETAISAVDHITTRMMDSPYGGKKWNAMDLEAILGPEVAKTMGTGFTFPGFVHGTAGIGFIYAVMYEVTGTKKYLDYALLAETYLEGIAVGDEKSALIPYQDMKDKDLSEGIFYLSMCHGPVGSSIFFRKLYEITGEQKYLDWVIRLTQGIIDAGAPEIRSAGYWNCHCLCCGDAGMLEHFVEVYELTKDEKYLLYAKRQAAQIIGSASRKDGMCCWYDAWYRLSPANVQSYTGLYVGAAGCAYALLRLIASEEHLPMPTRSFEYLFLG